MKKITFQTVLEEENQGHSVRKELYVKLEKKMGKPIISFYTSFVYPIAIVDKDADMIESILQGSDLTKGFFLIINSAGGLGLAAERIIEVCRVYSKNNFSAIIPKMAKSAATMICLGAKKILMSDTSELGPIDPQVIISDGTTKKLFPAHLIIESYENLFSEAIRVRQPIEIFLQQLAKYDARDIAKYRSETDLAKDIAERALRTGMMSKASPSEIDKTVKVFIEPTKTKAHGRPIYLGDLQETKLNTRRLDINSNEWKLIWELHIRLDYVVSRMKIGKIVESKEHSYVVSV